MTEPPATLTAALVALQADLPAIAKDRPAVYGKYAGLDAITDELMPRLSAYGLAWTCIPGYDDQQRWGLHLELLHVSGDSIKGFWEITATVEQKQGSAITYARRYALCAVTGLAPHGDDDDAQAASRREPEQQSAEQEEALDAADTRRAIAKGLVVEDMNALTEMISWVETSTIKDRDVSSLVTDQDRERLQPPDDTVFTLIATLSLARRYLQDHGHALRATKPQAEEESAE